MNQQNTETHSISDDEISLTEIIDFFTEHLKEILLCVAIGLAIGASYFFINASYTNTIVFKNNAMVDVPFLKRIFQEVPIYAKQLESENELYKKISNEKYWKENLKPTFALSKEDAKEFQLDKIELGSTINNFHLIYSGKDKNESQHESDEVFNFFKNTFLKIKIQDLLQRYKTEVQVGQLELEKKITDIKNEIDYLKTRAKNLEDLKIRFPNNQSTNINQVLDPKDSASKYLPVGTQLVAIYTELNYLNEQLKRNKDTKDIIDIKEKFISEFKKIDNERKTEAEKINGLFKYFSESLINLENTNGYQLSKSIAIRNLLAEINNLSTIDKLGFEVIDNKNEYATKAVAIPIGAFSGLVFGIFFAFALNVKKKYKVEKENRKNLGIKELTNA